jgi:hypothetical protein
MTTLKRSLIWAAVLASAITGQAQAQFMDMSGMIMSNLMFDQMMQQQAAAAAQQWYDNVQAYRRATGDYTTPALSGFNAQTLSAANQATSQAYDAYNQSWHQGSQAMSDAVSRYGQAILGQQTYADPNGTTYTLPNGANHYWADLQGNTYDTNTYAPPDYQNWYHQLEPAD